MEPGGQLDMQQILAAASAMQEQLFSAQQELADAEVLGTAGGGLVTVTVNGQGELLDVTIAADEQHGCGRETVHEPCSIAGKCKYQWDGE